MDDGRGSRWMLAARWFRDEQWLTGTGVRHLGHIFELCLQRIYRIERTIVSRQSTTNLPATALHKTDEIGQL